MGGAFVTITYQFKKVLSHFMDVLGAKINKEKKKVWLEFFSEVVAKYN
jgi:hypothetical protein